MRAYQSTYKRPGTLHLFAALKVATGEVQTAITQLKRREEFLRFRDQVVAESAPDQELQGKCHWRLVRGSVKIEVSLVLGQVV